MQYVAQWLVLYTYCNSLLYTTHYLQASFCRYCYEATGNCPRCGLITTGENKGKYWADLDAGAAEAREGEECRVIIIKQKQSYRSNLLRYIYLKAVLVYNMRLHETYLRSIYL
jgi:hypothetical protein